MGIQKNKDLPMLLFSFTGIQADQSKLKNTNAQEHYMIIFNVVKKNANN